MNSLTKTALTGHAHCHSGDSGSATREHHREGLHQLLDRKRVSVNAGHDTLDVTEIAPDLIETLDRVKRLGFLDLLIDPTAQQQQPGAHGQHSTNHRSDRLGDFPHGDSLARNELLERLDDAAQPVIQDEHEPLLRIDLEPKNWPTSVGSIALERLSTNPDILSLSLKKALFRRHSFSDRPTTKKSSISQVPLLQVNESCIQPRIICYLLPGCSRPSWPVRSSNWYRFSI